ncbi:TenA family protein [Halegenticoccus tardaugens]|uniref:TenA family protein n=1 Tax=Halegenticoccus tardaugens TaxID=2071624 RepID=UPI001E4B55E8|nr:TenA family protein [Halegenticoccus tardaugens]
MTGTFDDADADRFTEWLRRRSEPDWTAATTHRFTEELGDDALSDDAFRRYLVQDYAFVDTLASVVGYGVAQAPTMAEKRRLVVFLDALTDEEDDYFERSFDALGVPAVDRESPELTPTTLGFGDLLLAAARGGDYEETLAVLLAAEWVYHAWAARVADRSPDRFYLREWIALHANPEFDDFVGWLRAELDDRGPTLSPRRQRRVADLFRRAVAAEVAFFDAVYDG